MSTSKELIQANLDAAKRISAADSLAECEALAVSAAALFLGEIAFQLAVMNEREQQRYENSDEYLRWKEAQR